MKIKKVITFLIILISIISISLISSAAGFLEDFDGSTSATDPVNRVENVMGIALGVIQTIALAVAIIMLLVLGIKYMISSAEERAEIKKHLITYTIGALIMFGTSFILGVIKEFATNI